MRSNPSQGFGASQILLLEILEPLVRFHFPKNLSRCQSHSQGLSLLEIPWIQWIFCPEHPPSSGSPGMVWVGKGLESHSTSGTLPKSQAAPTGPEHSQNLSQILPFWIKRIFPLSLLPAVLFRFFVCFFFAKLHPEKPQECKNTQKVLLAPCSPSSRQEFLTPSPGASRVINQGPD